MLDRQSPLHAVAVLLLLAAFVAAQEPAKKSGPQPGSDLPGPFQPYNVTGKAKGRLHCPICPHGLNPAVLVFAPASESSEGFIKLIEGLDGLVQKYPRAKLGAFVVFQTDDVQDDAKREAAATKVSGVAKVGEEQVVLALDKAAGPPDYKLAEGTVTVLLYDKLRVVGNYAFDKPMADKDVERILKDVEKLAAAK